SGTAGSSSPPVTASPSPSSPAGTRPVSRGLGGRSPRPGFLVPKPHSPQIPQAGDTWGPAARENPAVWRPSLEVMNVAVEAPVDRPPRGDRARCGRARSADVGRDRPAHLVAEPA